MVLFYKKYLNNNDGREQLTLENFAVSLQLKLLPMQGHIFLWMVSREIELCHIVPNII
jgi:hypothetical protein